MLLVAAISTTLANYRAHSCGCFEASKLLTLMTVLCIDCATTKHSSVTVQKELKIDGFIVYTHHYVVQNSVTMARNTNKLIQSWRR